MGKRKLLIATTNEGKFIETQHFLADLPFTLIKLPADLPAPEEGNESLEHNAEMKARYYADKTGQLALADDAGLFIDALDGWPGVESARIGSTSTERSNTVLGKLQGKKKSERGAAFRIAVSVYDPILKSFYTVFEEERGEILEAPVVNQKGGFGYDPIFFVPEGGKTYAEMTIQEKNAVSHRGKALSKIKYFLQKQYNIRHVVVPVGFIIKDGKIIASRRNDPHRPAFHNKWEFPGGAVELGDDLPSTLIREVKEETGYAVEIVRAMQKIQVILEEDMGYQIYLVPYVCKVVGGSASPNDAEVLEIGEFDLDEFVNETMIGKNNELYKELLFELKEIVTKQEL